MTESHQPFSGSGDFFDGHAGLNQVFRDAATAGRAASGEFILDPDEWWNWTIPSSQIEEIESRLHLAGIEATTNSCRDKAPGPFLDWSDPDVESKYRSGSSGPEAFILRLP